MVSRRSFLKLTGAGMLSLFVSANGKSIPGVSAKSLFQRILAVPIPGGTLDPLTVPKYATPLLIPPAMPRAGTITQNGQAVDYYEIAVRQFQQQILPAGLPKTTVWGYGPVVAQNGPQIFNAPSLTIEAKHNVPTQIKWVNELVDANGNYLPHLLPVDPTLHWANPPGGITGRDMRPVFTETPGPYTGPVPIVTHVHGAVGVGEESDGYPEAWFLPAANNIPSGFAQVGSKYDQFAGEAASKYNAARGQGFAVFQYPNLNRAATIWYHDHTLGLTRLNVYAGPAGFYIIRGGPDDTVLDSRSSTAAVLPGPAPAWGDLPGTIYYEIPIGIQDRAFNTDGSLFYPDSRTFFDGATATNPGFIPKTDLSPIWNPEFFGNMIMVNGNTWPFQTVEQRRYRFRFLNGCQARFLILDFNQIPGVEVWQIGNEGGFLAAPVNLTAANGNRLLMGLAERADLIVDFTNVPVGNYVLENVGPDEPFGGGIPGTDFPVADPDTTRQIMQFRVVAATTPDLTTPPQFLQLPVIAPLPAAAKTRQLSLNEQESTVWAGPAEAHLGIVDAGRPVHYGWMDSITENVNQGETEVWEFYNFTADAHPMHVHEITFEVLNRESLAVDSHGDVVTPIQLLGNPRPPEAWESGRKDTVIAYPGEVTRIKGKFDHPGLFVWHCHIVEHEDNEMMRPYSILERVFLPLINKNK